MAVATIATSNNKKVWDNLNLFVVQAVDEAVEKEATIMLNTLRYRRTLLGEKNTARYPKDATGPSNGTHAYTHWSKKRGTGQFRWLIQNDAKAKSDGYPYARVLNFGVAPNARGSYGNPHTWTVTNSAKIVKGPRGRYYSAQLPNGLAPWLKRKRAIIADTIQQGIDKWG